MRRLRTILRSIFLPSPEWEAVEELERQNAELRKALSEFCDRVEAGQARSAKTYLKFKELLRGY